MRRMSQSVILAVILVWGLPSPAADSAQKELGKLKNEMEKLSKDVDSYSDQLKRTMSSLESVKMAEAGKLPKAFKAFDKDAEKLQKDYTQASKGMKEMGSKRDKYLSAWEQSSATLATPELRQAGEQRSAQIRAEHAKLSEDAAAAAGRIDGFMLKLNDLRNFLGSDLNPPAVTAASATIDEVLAEGRSLAAPVGAVGDKLGAFAGGL